MNFEQLRFMLENVCFNGDFMIDVIPASEVAERVRSRRVLICRDEDDDFGVPFREYKEADPDSENEFQLLSLHHASKIHSWLLTEDLHVTFEEADTAIISEFVFENAKWNPKEEVDSTEKPQTQYKILSSVETSDLERLVQFYLEQGWRLHGYPFRIFDRLKDPVNAQAVIK